MEAHRAGQLAEAERLYRRAVEADPADAQAQRLRGLLARERGDLVASGRYLARAAELAGADPRPAAELGVTRLAAGDLDGAEASLRAALVRDPGYARAHANLGALLQYRGHIEAAIAHHQAALAADADDVEVRCNLARALVDAGRGEDALACCDDGLDAAPAHPALLAARGAVLCDLERCAEALLPLEAALLRYPDDDTAGINLAYARATLGDLPGAIEALRLALRANPDSGRATADLVNLLAASAAMDEALALAAAFLEAHPGERQVLAAQGLALRDAGQAAQADALLDFGRMLRVVELAPPAGYADLDTFNTALCAAIEADPSLLASPASKATRGGSQTGELRFDAGGVLAGWRDAVDEAVRGVVADCLASGYADHPLMAPAAPDWTLRAWGTVLEEGGHQASHIHPLGWLSGVYYARLPAGMSAGAAGAGWIEFGRPPPRMRVATEPVTRLIEPRPGRLLLFPSWAWHRTLPFAAPGRRISLAFDVMPRRRA
ncbi:MAG: tetratricopeptide repeat protein [Gammaproteobacteria bacterium]|nr:MAG: tetratricopeptide repeat protein [Gammaproteobacteria bacterium]